MICPRPRLGEVLAAEGTRVWPIADREDAAVGGDQPVALAVGGGDAADNSFVPADVQAGGRPVRMCVTADDRATICFGQPLSLRAQGRAEPYDGVHRRRAP